MAEKIEHSHKCKYKAFRGKYSWRPKINTQRMTIVTHCLHAHISARTAVDGQEKKYDMHYCHSKDIPASFAHF